MAENQTQGSKILSPREIEILRLIATGHTDLEITERLAIGLDSVDGEIRKIFKKINVPNRLQAVLWAAKNL